MSDYPKTPKADFRWNCMPYVLQQVGDSCWYRAFGRNYLDLGDHRPYGSHRQADVEWIESGGMLLHISKAKVEKLIRLGGKDEGGKIWLYTDGTTPPHAWDRYQQILGYIITFKSNCTRPTPMRELLRKLNKMSAVEMEVRMCDAA